MTRPKRDKLLYSGTKAFLEQKQPIQPYSSIDDSTVPALNAIPDHKALAVYSLQSSQQA